jgi:hypothetical protein
MPGLHLPIPRSLLSSAAFVLAAGVMMSAGLTAVDDSQNDDRSKFTFALWGDTPYSDVEKTTIIPALIQDINQSKAAFTIFDGDIKSGSTRCEEPVYSDAIARFNSFDRPMVYVPGDNEWTDCHRINNGGKNALVQLAYIRSTMFAAAESFGREKLLLEHQGVGPDGVTSYPENTRWTFANVVFVGLNVPGSNNNKVHPGQCTSSKSARNQSDCDADNAEYMARDAANIQFLRESFDTAMARGARGVVVVVQADPSFDLPETETDNERTCVRAAQGECLDNAPDGTPPSPDLANYDGYDAFLGVLRSKTVEFGAIGGQVVFVHGDTHFFKVDKPLDGPTSLLPNFTRVCTFGSPGVNWVKVTVDPKSRNLFTFEPMIVPRS